MHQDRVTLKITHDDDPTITGFEVYRSRCDPGMRVHAKPAGLVERLATMLADWLEERRWRYGITVAPHEPVYSYRVASLDRDGTVRE